VLLDLTEILACPSCGPPNGLILLVESAEGRRVRRGTLGCPQCEESFPIEDGCIRLGPFVIESASDSPRDDAPDSTVVRETGILLAALCALDGKRGYVLLGPGLQHVAGELGSLVPAVEVVQVGPAADAVVPTAGPGLPFLDDGFVAAAFQPAGAVLPADGARVVRVGGRIVVLGELSPARAQLGASVRLLAADERASVFVREGRTARYSATLPDAPGAV
jgi:uncharacterized protein YbaR (Trm112 family)